MTTIHLIRHGQASFGSNDYDRLSALGGRQAELLGEYWAGQNVSFDRVYAGDLSRQVETACIVARVSETDVIRQPAFNEYPFHQLFAITAGADGESRNSAAEQTLTPPAGQQRLLAALALG